MRSFLEGSFLPWCLVALLLSLGLGREREIMKLRTPYDEAVRFGWESAAAFLAEGHGAEDKAWKGWREARWSLWNESDRRQGKSPRFNVDKP